MKRDNEKILGVIGSTETFLKAQLEILIEAGAKPDTFASFVQCLQTMEEAGANVGEYQIDNMEAIYEVAREAIAPIEKRLMQLIERLENREHDGDKDADIA